MGLLEKFKKRVNSPRFLRMKRKRSTEALTLASTCDVTEIETFDAIGASAAQKEEPVRNTPLCTKYEALEEEENELLSPENTQVHHQISDETETCNLVEDDGNSGDREVSEESNEDESITTIAKEHICNTEKKTGDVPRYVSSSSEDEEEPSNSQQKKNVQDSAAKSTFSTRLTETLEWSDPGKRAANDSLSNPYSKFKDDDSSDDGSEALTHDYHDDLSTLYEVPTDREDNDSIVSSNSMSDLEDILGGLRVSKKRRSQNNNDVDDSIIRARWDYALNMMCGNSSMFFKDVAKIEDDEMCDLDMAEI